MPASNWHDLYLSDFQGLWALLVVPFAFAIYRAVAGAPPAGTSDARSARFVWIYGGIWTIEALLDPLCTGPLSRALGLEDRFGGTLLMFTFVLLGDLRVFVLVFGLAQPDRPVRHWLSRSALATLLVPVFAGVSNAGLGLIVADLPGQTLWLVYELAFLGVTVYLARSWIPAHVGEERAGMRRMLQSCAGYAGAYYALWGAADVLILAGIDEGWAVRVIPNQLYYAFWVPFVHVRYFGLLAERTGSASRHASSSETQTPR